MIKALERKKNNHNNDTDSKQVTIGNMKNR